MKKIILLLALSVMLYADGNTVKVVFDLTSGDIQTFEKKVLKGLTAHITHYEGNMKEIDIAVIVHGDAYKFFLRDVQKSPYRKDKKLLDAHLSFKKRISFIADTYDVSFEVCEAGVVSKKLNKKEFYDFVSFVPNAAIGLIDKQNDGYAYIPID